MIRVLLRGCATIPAMLTYLVVGVLISAAVPGIDRRRRCRVAATCWFSRLGLRILGIAVAHEGDFNIQPGGLIVANHQSYVDILVIASRYPAVFVTSLEMRRRFLLGVLSSLGGSVFVHRRGIVGLRSDLASVAGVLRAGFTVCLFPEATSSNGRDLLPFKSALFAAVGGPVRRARPLCVKYVSINGNAADGEELRKVCYDGRSSFARHLFGLMKVRSIGIRVTSLDTIDIAALGRREAAHLARQRIGEVFRGALETNRGVDLPVTA